MPALSKLVNSHYALSIKILVTNSTAVNFQKKLVTIVLYHSPVKWMAKNQKIYENRDVFHGIEELLMVSLEMGYSAKNCLDIHQP